MNYINQLSNIESQSVLIIGDVMVDSYIWGAVDRISPEAPVPVVNVTETENRLGGAANVVKNIAALKLNPILCTVVGNDETANVLFELLENAKISTKFCIKSPQRKTTLKTRILSGNHQILRVDTEHTNSVSPELTMEMTNVVQKLLASHSVNAIIIEDYDKGVVTPELIQNITKFAKKYSIPVFVDPKKRNFNYYSDITVFKPNFKEFTEGVGKSCKKTDLSHLFILSKDFLEKQNIEILMITLSEHGIFIANKDEYIHIPSQVRYVSDVSGAGDTVISTAVACFLAKLPMADIARISNIAAGLACEQPGVVTINQEQLFKNL